ncbi:MAG: hypothetical protein EXS08_16565 [Planctomycetes bacterium]|nr:hypothetical protein [Planctomycetota bacterium]
MQHTHPATTPWLILFWLLTLGARSSAQGERAPELPEQLDPDQRSDELESEVRVPIVFEGFVLCADGNPAEGAVVVSSAGGQAITDVAGNYRLELDVPLEAESVQVTAIGRAAANLAASMSVALGGRASASRVPPLQLALGSTCSPSWLPTFGEQPATDGEVSALAVYDDGGGPALYAAGKFLTAGSASAIRIAKWDGSSWSALGSGVDGMVETLAVYDDGLGPALYAGGHFTIAGGTFASGIARWDGTSWSALGGGVTGGSASVYDLAVYDDGSGPALYVGGFFSMAGPIAARYIAKWDGSSWAALGSGMNSYVYALAVYDDGAGPKLYV